MNSITLVKFLICLPLTPSPVSCIPGLQPLSINQKWLNSDFRRPFPLSILQTRGSVGPSWGLWSTEEPPGGEYHWYVQTGVHKVRQTNGLYKTARTSDLNITTTSQFVKQLGNYKCSNLINLSTVLHYTITHLKITLYKITIIIFLVKTHRPVMGLNP